MSDIAEIETAVGVCELRRSDRTTLAIHIHPEERIELVAPLDAAVPDIVAKVERRYKWIERKRREFALINTQTIPLRYFPGATHRYLGRQYRIKWHQASLPSVVLKGQFFHIYSPTQEESSLRGQLDKWFRDRAREQFSRRLDKWKKWCTRNELPEPKLKLRSMQRRWGSANRNGTINLNPLLIRTPSICVDYVIAHEICHLKHPGHNKAFYNLLEEIFPNWKPVKLKLEQAEL